MKPADKRKLESRINGAADDLIDKSYTNYTIDKNTIEQERTDALQSRCSLRPLAVANAFFNGRYAEQNGRSYLVDC